MKEKIAIKMKAGAVVIFCSILSFTSIAVVAENSANDAAPESPSARTIVENLLNRNDGKSQISRQKLSSCRYAIKNKKMGCVEKPRIKRLENVRKDYGENEKDIRSISIVLDPPGEKGIGFLQYDYDEPDKDADQWMYLSALGKVKRIVSGNDDEPKEGSFFGSEFSYEDLEQRYIDDYTYTKLEDEVYQGRDCWVIESKPTAKQARKSNYSKSVSWIDKERNISLKVLLYNRQGKREKRLSFRHVKQVNGIWVAFSMNIDNLLTKRMSNLKLERTAFNVPVEDDFLTLRTLTDGAFRENRLNRYRGHIAN